MSLNKPITEISLATMRRVLHRNKGAAAEIARRLNVTQVSVGHVLQGRTKSARILAACEAKAKELLKQEASDKAA